MQADGDNENKEDFEVFLRSSQPGKRWGGGRVVFFLGENGPPTVKRSNNLWNKHPESEMLKDLHQMLPNYRGSSLEVTVLQNASPCESCSQEYTQLVDKARDLKVDLKLHVVFVALYKVRRPSKMLRPSYSVLNLPQEVHQQNVRGLQSLKNLGVELCVFGSPDWQRLRKLLRLPPDWQEEVVFEDKHLRRDLQDLLVQDVESHTVEDEDEEEEELAEWNEEDVGNQLPEAPEELDRKGQFFKFWDSGVHGVRWGRGAIALYVIEGQEASEIFRNTDKDGNSHAEALLLRDLKKRLLNVPGTDIKVTIYQNLSPCGSCCEKYDTFLTSHNGTKNIKLTIIFSMFYKIKRPSCAECNLHPIPSSDDHYSASEGLRRLRDRGVALHCFQEQDWVALHQHLQVPGPPADYASSRRKLEDDLMAADAKKVFGFDMVARAGGSEGGGMLVFDQGLMTLKNALRNAMQDAMQDAMENAVQNAVEAALREPLQRIEVFLRNLQGQDVNMA